jgi:hypothetical protein
MIKSNITAAVEAQDYQLAASLKTMLTDAQDKLAKALKFEAAIGNEFPIPDDLYNKSYTIYNEKIKNFEVKYSNDINMIMVYIKYFLLIAADRGCSFVAFSSFQLGKPVVLFQDGFTYNFCSEWVSSITNRLRTVNEQKQNFQQYLNPSFGCEDQYYKDQVQLINKYQERLKEKLSSIKEINETLTEPINILSSPINEVLNLAIEWKLLEMGYIIGQGFYNRQEWLVISLWPFTESRSKASYIKFNGLQWVDLISFPLSGYDYTYQGTDYKGSMQSIDFKIFWNYNVTGVVYDDDDRYL